MDYEVGGIFGRVSSIADIKQRKTLMIFHRQKAAQFLGDGRDLSTRLSNPFGFLTESPQNLWNLRDGTEERLENRQIDSQSAEGFRVRLQGEVEGIEFRQEITIWAQARTGVPLLVEILVTSTTDPEQTVKITLSDFNINVELDDSLFDMEPPADYILRYSKSLDEVLAAKAATEPTPTGRQVEQALDLWERGQQDQAAEIMLQIDWTGPVSFSMHLYNFTLTEKEYITLTLEDGEQASREFIALNSRCRALTRHLVSLGQNDKDQGETDKAERFFRTVYRFGMLIKGNEETLINTRMVGYAVTISGLRELTALYGETGDQEKLDWARQENQKVDAARIKYRDSIR